MNNRTIFASGSGLPEMFYTDTAIPGRDFKSECETLFFEYVNQLSDFSPVWVKLHLSDISNQATVARQIFGELAVPLSLVGQPPANGARIALEAWHLPRSVMHRDGVWHLENYTLHYFNMTEHAGKDSFEQMHNEFVHADRQISALGGNIETNLQRTWIYCRDVDNNYAGLVRARKEYFDRCGLVAGTHYITSTGIDAQSDPYDRLVRMDSLAIYKHERDQVQYLEALENLSPTHIYGVTFERGTRMIYGDRSHYYISGTASIDKAGEIVYPGDVCRQTERVIENMDALFAAGGGSLKDLKQAVVYLRDGADREIVEAVLSRSFAPETSYIIVRGPVCRPGWLVEIEGIGVNANGRNGFKDFI